MYNKAVARKLAKKKRDSLKNRAGLSLSICKNAAPLVSGSILVYIPIGSEADTVPLIKMLWDRPDITLFAPYTVGKAIVPLRLCRLAKPDGMGNLPRDCYFDPLPENISEDAAARLSAGIHIDCSITPLLAVGSNGQRLGYGKGCYDAFFAGRNIKKIGFCFECQLEDVAALPHDIPLDCCVTENKVIYFDHASNIGKV